MMVRGKEKIKTTCSLGGREEESCVHSLWEGTVPGLKQWFSIGGEFDPLETGGPCPETFLVVSAGEVLVSSG